MGKKQPSNYAIAYNKLSPGYGVHWTLYRSQPKEFITNGTEKSMKLATTAAGHAKRVHENKEKKEKR